MSHPKNSSTHSLFSRKAKASSYENREKVYPPPAVSSYNHDETMDLSTKWRAPPSTTTKPPATPSHHPHHKRPKPHSPHSRMLPRKRHHSTSPDVIVLSDEEQRQVNGHRATPNGHLSPSLTPGEEAAEEGPLPPLPVEREWAPGELREKRRLLRELRDELRSEEMKLVLLKKLHQSQAIKESLVSVASKIVPAAAAAVAGNRGAAVPPPLVRSGQQQGQQQAQGKMLGQQLSHQSTIMGSPMVSYTTVVIKISIKNDCPGVS